MATATTTDQLSGPEDDVVVAAVVVVVLGAVLVEVVLDGLEVKTTKAPAVAPMS
jgi:phosphoglycerate-specific signal transduction histidine kinase